jgi:sRNA-binding regulator protein Hfq
VGVSVQRPGQDDRRKPKRRPADPAAKARAEQMAANGMPMQMAMAVAHGKLTLNDALQRLAQRDAVTRMMDKHLLSRALATQIILGQASLDVVLATRRMDEHRAANRNRSILDTYQASAAPITLHLHGHRKLTGVIQLVDAYMFRFLAEGATEPEDLHKLQVKLAFDPEAFKRVRKILKYDRALQAAPIGPVARPQDRYACSDRRLFGYMDSRAEVQVTLLEGEQLHGAVAWFSRFEFGLALKADAEIVVFRHALHSITE